MTEQSKVAPVEAQAVPDLPVAWRFRCLGEGLDWLISEKQPRSDWFEVEPLFTRPTPAAADLHQQIMNLPHDAEARLQQHSPAELFAYRLGHRDARHAAAQLVAASPAAAADWQISAIADKHVSTFDGRRVLDEVSFGRELLQTLASPAAAAGGPTQCKTCKGVLPVGDYMDRCGAGMTTMCNCPAPAAEADLTDEQIEVLWKKWVGTPRPNFSFARALLSRPGCELATDATKQQMFNGLTQEETDATASVMGLVHLAATPIDQDFRDGQELPTAAPQVGEPGLQDIFRNPALLKMPGEEWEFDDDTAVKWAWFAHGQHTGMTAYFSGAQLRAAFNAGSGQDFRRRPASSEAAPSAEGSE